MSDNGFSISTDGVRWAATHGWGSIWTEDFDRWLSSVKAEAWEEGWDAAYKMARGWGHVDGWEAPWPTNPYREGVL